MKRTPILLAAVLALVLAACGESTASPTIAPTPTADPTPEATPTPTEADSDATDDGTGSGFTGALSDALPDEIGGLQRTDMTGMEQMILPMLEQQGIDAEEADFAFATYGQGELIVTGFSVPGVAEGQLQLMAQMMSGMQVEGAEDLETETVNVGGKEVLRMTTAGEPQSVFIYIAEDAMFTVVAESEELAQELLSQLP